MKWFKHDTDARNDTKLKLLKKKFGAEGYGVYFQLIEIVGQNIKDKNQTDWGFVESIHTIDTLSDESGVSPDKLRSILKYMNELELVFHFSGRLCLPKILTRLDEYAQKRRDGIDVYSRELELTRQCRDTIGTVSGEHRALEQIRLEQIREEKSVKHPTSDDFQNIADQYNVPLSFVMSKWDDLQNWCKAKGKTYKDYVAALKNWVKKDAIERIDNARTSNQKSAVDLSNL